MVRQRSSSSPRASCSDPAQGRPHHWGWSRRTAQPARPDLHRPRHHLRARHITSRLYHTHHRRIHPRRRTVEQRAL